MALLMKAEVTYFDGSSDEHVDTVHVRDSLLPQWLRDMASDIEQEGLKIVSINITISGVLHT